MIAKAITGLVALAMLVVAMLVMFPDISQTLEAARTDPATDIGLSCTTGASDTSCAVTISAPHQYSTTAGMTVTETSPGAADQTAASTVGFNRTSVTVSGLATSTAYTFDVVSAIRAANVSEGAGELLRLFIPLMALLLVGATVAGAVASFGVARRG